jgi:acyl carrier protein
MQMSNTVESIKSKIETIAKGVFNNPGLVFEMNTTAKDVDGWDSMTNLLLIDAIETDFGIKFSLDEILEFKNIGEICTCILNKS